MRLSDTSSPPLRLELTPSRWLEAALAGLALCAVLSVVISAMPWMVALTVPVLWWRARAVLHASNGALALRTDGSVAWLRTAADGIELDTPVQWRGWSERGPFAVLVFATDDRVHRIACAPDTLDAAARRRVRLWVARHAASRGTGTRNLGAQRTAGASAHV